MDTDLYRHAADAKIERRAKEVLDAMHHSEDGRITVPSYANRWHPTIAPEHALTMTACNLLVARGLAVRCAGFFHWPTFRLLLKLH